MVNVFAPARLGLLELRNRIIKAAPFECRTVPLHHGFTGCELGFCRFVS
jgi:2,4-dienoyl-CoA reductase-like NADH-dependent reductase (Old Yellow Enzyme family)